MKHQAKRIHGTEGQSLVEYAMILGLVALIVALALASVGVGVDTLFQIVNNGLSTLRSLFGP